MGPLEATTTYFEPSSKNHMFNLIVDDLDGALRQAEEGGSQRVGKIEEYDFGRFGGFMDPDGNKVELWQIGDDGIVVLEPECRTTKRLAILCRRRVLVRRGKGFPPS